MRTARAADNGIVGLDYHIHELLNCAKVILVTYYLVVFKQALKAAHHLVSLYVLELIRIKLLGKTQLDKVHILAEARLDEIRREVEVTFFSREIIELYKRLKNRAGVKATPEV